MKEDMNFIKEQLERNVGKKFSKNAFVKTKSVKKEFSPILQKCFFFILEFLYKKKILSLYPFRNLFEKYYLLVLVLFKNFSFILIIPLKYITLTYISITHIHK